MTVRDWRWWTSCGLLAGSLLATRIKDIRPAERLARPLAAIPVEIAGWRGSDDPPLEPRIAQSLGASAYLSRTYRRGSRSASLFIAYYANPRAGETMHSPKHCLPGGGWEPIELSTVTVRTEHGLIGINKYVLYRAGEQSIVLYWYQTPERVIASEYLSKIYMVWDTLRGRSPASAIVRVAVPAPPEPLEEAAELCSSVMRELARCYRR